MYQNKTTGNTMRNLTMNDRTGCSYIPATFQNGQTGVPKSVNRAASTM